MKHSSSSFRHPRHLKARPLVALLATALLPLAGAQTLPGGLSVVSGQASAQISGGQMTVTNSANAILNWQSFSIGAGNGVHFAQPSAASQVLNRVAGNDPSAILGSLSSNGRVWLLNPNGVLFGQNARVDVAGLVTSTLNLSNEDWLAGRHVFSSGSGQAAGIVNQGQLRTSLGGRVALLGGTVENQGLIEAPGGQVVLAAGRSVELLDTGAPHLTVKVTAPQGEALNLGTLAAAGGRIDVHGAAVNQQGIVRADSLERGPAGEILLKASERLSLKAGSITAADGAADGATTGGKITLLGREVGLFDDAAVSASGQSGGGEVLVGGGQQGRDASLPNAQSLFFGRAASIHADALESGDGGRIILWSDKATRAFGTLSAHGGARGGDGGFIETSGGWLDARPFKLDLSAPRGKAGRWLLDPYNIRISDVVSEGGYDANFTATADDAEISSSTLTAALDAGVQVTVSTGGAGNGGQLGTITLDNATIWLADSTTGASLSLIADQDIVMQTSQIIGDFAQIRLLAGSSTAGAVAMSDSQIFNTSSNGQILIGGHYNGLTPEGGVFGNATAGHAGRPDGISLTGGSRIIGTDSVVTLNGGANGAGRGVFLGAGSELSARELNINGWSGSGDGVQIFESQLSATGAIRIGGASSGSGIGVGIYDGTTVTVSPGVYDPGALLSVQGLSSGSNYGVLIDSPLHPWAQLRNGNGAALQLRGANLAGGAPALHLIGSAETNTPLLDGSGGGAMSLSAFGGGDTVAFFDVQVRGSSMGLTVAAPMQLFENTQIDSAGPITLQGQSIYLEAGTSIHSSRIGDAILVSNGSAPVDTFINNAGAGALQVDGGGRWIIWANDVDAGNFQSGGLVNDFTRYGADSPTAWAGDAGNGFVSAQQRYADVYGYVEDRPYNGTRGATVNELSIWAGEGISGEVKETAYALFDSKNVVMGYGYGGYGGYGEFFAAAAMEPVSQPVRFYDDVTPGSPYRFSDSMGKPVYGMTVSTWIEGVITPKEVSATVTVANKVYDAGTAATVTVGAVNGLVGGETLNISALGSFGDKNVGQNKPVSAQFVIADGGNGGLASNYMVATPSELSGNITPATLSLSGLSAGNKVYDASTAASIGGSAFVSAFGSDSVSVVGTAQGSFSDKNVGSGKSVSVSGLSLAGQDAGNYVLDVGSLSASITPATLVVGGLSVNNKVYDATTAATLNGSASLGGFAGDQLSLSGGQASFVDKNVGQGKTVLLNGFTLSGADAGNYSLQLPTSLTADITPAPLNLLGLVVANKVYDATTAATLSGSAQLQALGSDQLSLGGTGQASFADKNVGQGKAVLLSGFTLSGADADNYSLQLPTNLTADITPATVVLSGLSANSKVYDAGTAATLSGTASVGGFAGDQLSVSGGQASFVSKNVGQGKGVTLSGFTLGGADAGNYSLQLPTNLTADITPATLVLSGLSANNKVYDAGTAATLSGTASVSGFAGDQLSVSGGQASFASKNVGQGKGVTLSGFALGGADAGNYSLQLPTNLTADITPATLVVTGLSANSKVYDGTLLASLSGNASVAALGGDQLSLSGTVQALFADRNAGTGKAVSVSGFVLGGADAGNYLLQQPSGLRADITPATLRYVAQTLTLFTGDALPALGGSVEGFVTGDNLQNATTGTLSFNPAVANTLAPAGSYAIDGSGLQAVNYVLVQDAGNAQALVLAGPNPANALNQGSNANLSNSVQAAAVQAPTANPLLSGLIDMTLAPAAGVASPTGSAALANSAAAATANSGSFGSIRIGDMSQEALAELLNARDRYKKGLFAEALSRLEQDPTLADLRACTSLKEVEAGTCLITAELKSAAQAGQESAPAVAAAAAAGGQAAAPSAPQPQIGTPAAAAAAVVAQLPQFNKRRVKAAALPQIERKVALLIGIDNYADANIPRLSNAVGDARAVGRLFESKLGYETMVISNASKQEVVTALNRLALELGPRDSVVVYYAGHGELIESSKQGYWQLADSDAKKPETWLSNADIARLVGQIGASQVAVISDSCYSGALAGGERIRATPGAVDPGQVLARKSVVVMSSGGNEPVFDEGKQGHSPFAWNLMSQLNGVSNWQLGGNVFERVRFAVARELPQRPQYGAAAGHQSGGDYLFEQRQLDDRL